MSGIEPAADPERLVLYLCIRWGHAQSAEGADGEDTSYIVRAGTHIEAARLADKHLKWLPTHVPSNPRWVEDQCHCVVEIGADRVADAKPGVLAGPYIGYQRGAIFSMDELHNYRSWSRGELETGGKWFDQVEVEKLWHPDSEDPAA